MNKYKISFVVSVPDEDDVQWTHLQEELECYFDSYENCITVSEGTITTL